MKRERLQEMLTRQYSSQYPKSKGMHEEAQKYLIDGGSHTIRLFSPCPFRAVSASGSRVRDVDGHQILDFWQGHMANVLGHNSPVITQAMAEAFRSGKGLHTGIAEALQTEFARLLMRQVGAERLRFTTSGSLATMYAIMLARAFTGRQLILKVGGGWHGAQPLALKGVRFGKEGYTHVESDGLSEYAGDEILITRYNDPDDLRKKFRRFGDRIACFIVEPWAGLGGFIPATVEYLRAAREETEGHTAILIFDEIISGFRFCASGVQRLYQVKPDLSTFGKIIGGGMPLSAVMGREEIMRLCGSAAGHQVKFEGGTFSAHPAALLAGKTLIEHLVHNEDDIYPRLGALGQKIRMGIEKIFASHGILARCTGYGNEVVPNSSLAMVHFPYDEKTQLTGAETIWDPKICDVELREKLLRLALLLERVHVVHGLGAVSAAHSEEDIEWLFQACDETAKLLKQYR